MTDLIKTSFLSLVTGLLPSKLFIKEDESIGQHEFHIKMESLVIDYINQNYMTDFSKKLHNVDTKKKILLDIQTIINGCESNLKIPYRTMWENYLNDVVNNKENIDLINKIKEKILNKKIISDIDQTLNPKIKIESFNNSTIKSLMKTILNFGTPPKEIVKKNSKKGGSKKEDKDVDKFKSIFAVDTLDTKEDMIMKHTKEKDVSHAQNLDIFIEETKYSESEEMIMTQFYNTIRLISDPRIRNQYYNQLLEKLVSELTIQVGKDMKMKVVQDKKLCKEDEQNCVHKITERIFVQMYLYFKNYESIKLVSEKVLSYIKLRNPKWFSYQVNEFTNKLCPNWVFKPKFSLEPWQKFVVKAVNNGENVLAVTPTSAGKTVVSFDAINSSDNVVFICPAIPLANQTCGNILATLHNKNDVITNVRLETEKISFKVYPHRPDNIIIATPKSFYNLLVNKKINPNFGRLIVDEAHMMNDIEIGGYIEYIIKFGAYYNIPLMLLSATIPNYTNLKDWLDKITNTKFAGVLEERRFYQMKRWIVKNGKLSEINILEHMTPDILLDPGFKQIGLYPIDLMKLHEQVLKIVDIPELHVDETIDSVVSLDKLHLMENQLFKALKSQPLKILDKIFSTSATSAPIVPKAPAAPPEPLEPPKPIVNSLLTHFKLFNVIKECKNNGLLPMLIFKMNSKECNDIFNIMLELLEDYQHLVYPNYNNVNTIIQEYFDTVEREEKKIKVERDDKKKGSKYNEDGSERDKKIDTTPKDFEQLLDELKQRLFDEGELPSKEGDTYQKGIGIKYKLIEWYHLFINDYINIQKVTIFNEKYGASLSPDEIVLLRTKHANKELKIYNKHENLRLRNVFQAHPECRLSSSSMSYDEMKKIRSKISAENTREARIKYGLQTPVKKIPYGHPYLKGIERGMLCCTELLEPAFQRATQNIMNTYQMCTFADKSMSIGINCSLKTVMLLGSMDPENPIEEISNETAWQGFGRAGRRGLENEGHIIFSSGLDTSKLLIPKYPVVKPNSEEIMSALIPKDSSEDFKNFILKEVRPDKSEQLWDCSNSIDIDALALEMYNTQNVLDTTVKGEGEEGEYEQVFVGSIRPLEVIKAELIAKLSFKPNKSVPLPANILLGGGGAAAAVELCEEESDKNIVIVNFDNFDFGKYDDWETAADEDALKAGELVKKVSAAEAEFM